MNKLTWLTFGLLVCAGGVSLAEVSTPADLTAYVQSRLNPIEAFEVQYHGWMYVPAETGAGREEFWQGQIAFVQDAIAKRKAGTLTPEEEKRIGYKTLEELEALLQNYERHRQGFSIESFYVFSRQGDLQRCDVFRPNDQTEHHAYLFDGQEGYVYFANKKQVTRSPSFTERWSDPTQAAGYGFNLNQFLGDDFQIVSYDAGRRILQVKPLTGRNQDNVYEFTLMEGRPEYWTQVDVIQPGGADVERVLCREFQEKEGILVPGEIVRQKLRGAELQDSLRLELVEANFHDLQFPQGFFQAPEGKEIVMKEYSR